MLATYVNDKLTPLPFELASKAMRASLRNELGGANPSNAALALALAKCALETGRMRSCHNWNWGNIKAGQKYEGMYCCFELNEVLPGQGTVWFSPLGRLDKRGGKVVAEAFADPPGHPQTRMRAHENEFTGADAYIDFMVRGSGGRFHPAFGRMLSGDVAGMVRLMKVANYFTAPEVEYARGVTSIQREYLFKLEGKSPETFDPGPAWFDEIRLIIGPAWKLGDDALESFVLNEMERELDAGPQAGRNLLDFESDDSDGNPPPNVA
jgi:hypothetical protein